MNEQKDVSKIFNRIWELFKEYKFEKLSNEEWEKLVSTVDEDVKGMQKNNIPKRFEMLYRDFALALENYYENRGKDV